MSSSPSLRAILADSSLNAKMQATDRVIKAYEMTIAKGEAERRRRLRESARSRRIQNWEKENFMPAGARAAGSSESSEFSSPRGNASDSQSDYNTHSDGDVSAEKVSGVDAETRDAAYHGALVPHHENDAEAFKAFVEGELDLDAKWQSLQDWVRVDSAVALEEKDAERAVIMQQIEQFEANKAKLLGECAGANGKRKRDASEDCGADKRRRVWPELAAAAPERHHDTAESFAEAALQTISCQTATHADNATFERTGSDENPDVEDGETIGTTGVGVVGCVLLDAAASNVERTRYRHHHRLPDSLFV